MISPIPRYCRKTLESPALNGADLIDFYPTPQVGKSRFVSIHDNTTIYTRRQPCKERSSAIEHHNREANSSSWHIVGEAHHHHVEINGNNEHTTNTLKRAVRILDTSLDFHHKGEHYHPSIRGLITTGTTCRNRPSRMQQKRRIKLFYPPIKYMTNTQTVATTSTLRIV